MIRLFRRREVVLPNARGWLLLLLAAAIAAVLVGRNLHAFLAVNQPVGAKLLVVEGWMGPRCLDQAVAAFRSGRYERVVTTGGPIESWPLPAHRTYAELAADYLKQHGLAEALVTAVPAPPTVRDRTFLSAVMVRDWTEQAGLAVEALDVFSLGTHARRSRLVYRLWLSDRRSRSACTRRAAGNTMIARGGVRAPACGTCSSKPSSCFG